MDKIIKAKLILPSYLSADARELIRNVSRLSLLGFEFLFEEM
jgi:hypothetical protein